MGIFSRLLIVALLVYGVISGDIKLNAPVLIPVLVELVKLMDQPSKGGDE